MGFHSIQVGRPKSFRIKTKSNGSWYWTTSPVATLGGAGAAKIRPTTDAGNAKAKPARGPAIPMSNNARRDLIGSLILITAPSVPNSVMVGGAGMKNGNVARIP